jgi:hypothetical protein
LRLVGLVVGSLARRKRKTNKIMYLAAKLAETESVEERFPLTFADDRRMLD